MTRNYIYLLLFILAIVGGCDLPESIGVVDQQIPPSIFESNISPNEKDFSDPSITGSIVEVSITGYVLATDDNGLNDIVSVN
ncbi:MAG TPA: hypothetical protein DCQ28_14060, partial [Bacteroidetes bacterium]|nr:hypothetical protein [Bacteroidota bacterium]